MQELLLELSVGDTLRIDTYSVKVVAITGDDIEIEIVDDGQNEVGEVVPICEEELVTC